VLLDGAEKPMTLLAPATYLSVATPDLLQAGVPGRSKFRLTPAGAGWLALLAILAAVIAARAFDVVPVPECRTTPTRLAFVPVTEMRATVSAGTPCLVSLRLGSARVQKLAITLDPQHGVVAPRGRTGVIYRPQSGFRGEDTFWFSLDGPSNRNPGAAVVRVGITVK
jgi:hypothetical protein